MKQAWPPFVQAVQALPSVPDILGVMAEMTGLRFVCVAHVTETSWTTCAVLDQIGFGLQPGDELDLRTTLCNSVRAANATIVIDHASEDELFRDHPTPRLYGFESYVSIPLHDRNGGFFGTLCGLDPKPLPLSDSKTVKSLGLFAQLISGQIDAEKRYLDRNTELSDEKATAMLREQFIAVLGHDIRTPLSSILHGAEILLQDDADERTRMIARTMQRSGQRIARMIDDVLDFTRGRLGGGIALDAGPVPDLDEALRQVVAECQNEHPGHRIEAAIGTLGIVWCNRDRVAQVLANLLGNALRYGRKDAPVRIGAGIDGGTFTLTVTNEGDTIAPEKLGKLFQPYWRDDERQPRRGLGLGLYIASEIAKAHGGTLEVASSDGLITFTFAIPAGLR